MIALGLDIGSRSIDAVWMNEKQEIVDSCICDTTFDPLAVTGEILRRQPTDRVVATGYGRHEAAESFGASIITEIKAHGMGAHWQFPEARSVLDIGGQDTKVILLDESGHVSDFQMNDKCAAGTGKFLEVMARALGFTLEEMAENALQSQGSVSISAMCTVFAESEVTGLIHKGVALSEIAGALIQSIATRTISSLIRMRARPPYVFSGGVAKNKAMRACIAEKLGQPLLIASDPQLNGAIGAALSGVTGE